MKKFFVMLAIIFAGNFFATCHAEIKTIEADGFYIMGDGMEENPKIAK